jgi:hypothetical protein
MTTANDYITQLLTASQRMLHRYVDDLSPQEYLHRATPQSNCTAWIIGHLTLSDRGALKQLGVSDLPALPEGFEQRIVRDAAAAAKANDFGDVQALLPLFDQHRALLIEAVKRASASDLERPLAKPNPMFGTVGQLAAFMALHAGVHAGQITMIRRSLGRAVIV